MILQKDLIGIDISDYSIKILKLGSDGSVVAYGQRVLPEGVVKKGLIVDNNVFSKELRTLLEDTKPASLYRENALLPAALSIPESKLFTHFMNIPSSEGESDLRAYIQDAVSKIVPASVDTLYWDYLLIEGGQTKDAVFVGAPRSLIDNYINAFNGTSMKPVFLGSELFSLSRALLTNDILGSSSLIIDIGAHTSDIGVFDKDGVIHLSVMVPIGGEYLTEKIAETLSVSRDVAEAKKIKEGFQDKRSKKGVSGILRTHMKDVVDEVLRSQKYFEEKTHQTIENIVLAGGSALLPDIDAYFEKKTGIRTIRANPFVKVRDSSVFDEETLPIFYANVIGLALLSVEELSPSVNLHAPYATNEEKIAVSSKLLYRLSAALRKRIPSFKKPKKEGEKYSNATLIASIFFALITLSLLTFVVTHYL